MDVSNSSKSMTLNEMKLGRSFAECVFPPTIESFLDVDGGLGISRNSLKTWWPGTELNRRRQPFQGWTPEQLSTLRFNQLTT